MDCGLVSQYCGESAIHKILMTNLSREKKYDQFRCICAIVSKNGIGLINDQLTDFLQRGNTIKWIFGLGEGSTSKESCEYLRFLKQKYPDNVEIKVIGAGNDRYLIHPKIYWFENDEEHEILLGSSNFTRGGLLQNFEVSINIRLKASKQEDRKLLSQFEELWNCYYQPRIPLDRDNLIDILELNIKNIPEGKVIEYEKTKKKQEGQFSKADKSREISENIKIHNPDLPSTREFGIMNVKEKEKEKEPTVLIMDITKESRGGTLVQIPKPAASKFFHFQYPDRKEITTIFVDEKGNEEIHGNRLLYSQTVSDTVRIEIPEIKNKERWLIIRFTKSVEDSDIYRYDLFFKDTYEHKKWDRYLEEFGKRKRMNSRRYVII